MAGATPRPCSPRRQRSRLIGIDRDPEAVEAGLPTAGSFGERLWLVQANFRELDRVLDERNVDLESMAFCSILASRLINWIEQSGAFATKAMLLWTCAWEPDQRQKTAAELLATLPVEEIARFLRSTGRSALLIGSPD